MDDERKDGKPTFEEVEIDITESTDSTNSTPDENPDLDDMKRHATETADAIFAEFKRAFTDGKADAKRAASDQFGNIGGKVGKGAYTAAYAASYAMAFGSSIMKDVVPDNFKEGAAEGTEAGRDAFDAFRKKVDEAMDRKKSDEGPAPEPA